MAHSYRDVATHSRRKPHQTSRNQRAMTRFLLVVALLVVSCGPSDPHERELRAESAYARSLAEHSVVRNLARDPQTKAITPSSVVGAMFSTMAAASLPVRERPEGQQVTVGRCPGKPEKAWMVGVIPDDEKGVIRLEGYGEKLDHPLFVETVTIR